MQVNALRQIERICIVGLDEIGLPLAVSLSMRGFTVSISVAPQALNATAYPEDLRTVIQEALLTGRLRISSQPEPADLFIITRPHENSLRKTLQGLVPYLGRRIPIILCSVRPHGLLYHAAEQTLKRAGLEPEKDFYLICHAGPALLKRSLERPQDSSQQQVRSYYYRRPYLDAWGNWHHPATSWDELLKYYKHWVVLLVSEATRRMAQPASVGAYHLLKSEKRRYKNLLRAQQLEAQYLMRECARRHRKRVSIK